MSALPAPPPPVGEPRVEIRRVGRWTYELVTYRGWIGMTGPRVLGARRAARKAALMLVDMQREPEVLAVLA